MPEWLSTTLKIVGGVAIIAGCIVGSIFTGGALVVLASAAIGEWYWSWYFNCCFRWKYR